MDLTTKQSEQITKLILIFFIIVISVGLLLFFLTRKNDEQIIVKNDKFTILYKSDVDLYTIKHTDKFYQQKPEEILKSINEINTLTGRPKTSTINLPAFIFKTPQTIKDKLKNIDTNINIYNDPMNGYPGE